MTSLNIPPKEPSTTCVPFPFENPVSYHRIWLDRGVNLDGPREVGAAMRDRLTFPMLTVGEEEKSCHFPPVRRSAEISTSSGGRRILAAVTLVATLGACADDTPPPPPPGGGDAGRPPDSAIALDGAVAQDARRPGEPLLPMADIEVVLPYLGPEQSLDLQITASLGRLDVHFSVDTTGSFGEEIDALQNDLELRILPSLEARVPNVAFGVSRFEDFPSAPYGMMGDLPFRLLSPITTDIPRAASAVASLDQPLGRGGDIPESGLEAVFQVATGVGYARGGTTIIEPFDGTGASGELGGVGYRAGALHTLVHVTDAPTHIPSDYDAVYPGTRGLTEVSDAADALDLFILGISSGEAGRSYLESLALNTGAVVDPTDGTCPTGLAGASRDPVAETCPLVFDIARDGTGLSEAVVDALAQLVNTVRFGEVFGRTVDDRFDFVEGIDAIQATPPTGIPAPTLGDSRPLDGIDDTFLAVGPGTTCVFRARLRNTTLPPADYDQVFRIGLEILGDELVLSEQTIRVIVPRGRLDRDASVTDAAAADDGSPPDGTVDGSLADAG